MGDQVAEVKSRVDLPQLIGERVPLKQRGRRFVGLCPFHSEKTPSFTVSPDIGIFKCFGCGAAGDAFTFLERYDGMTFPEALEYLADRVGVKLTRRTVDERTAEQDRKILEVHHLAAEYYHYLLTEHRVGEKARVYLKERGVSKTAIDHFFLGYALDRWDGLISYLTKKGYDPELLGTGGLVIQSRKQKTENRKQNYYDRFRGRVMFPLRDPRGQVIGFAGRLLDPNVKEAKYINSPETSLYHKGKHLYGIFENRELVRSEDRVVLVEGELDAISSWKAGIRNVVAIKGTALTDDQVKLIRRSTRNITMALDADDAGWEALRRSLPILEAHGMNVRVAALPSEVKDPDELVQKHPDRWRDLVGNAVNVYDALLSGVMMRIGIETGEQKKQVSEIVIPVLAGIQNAIEQDHWIRDVARHLDVREEAVRRQIDAFRRSGVLPSQVVQLTTRPHAYDHSHTIGKYLAALVIQFRLEVPTEFDTAWVEPLGIQKILLRWQNSDGPGRRAVDVRSFRNALPEELRPLFDEVATMPTTSDEREESDAQWIRQELLRTVTRIEREWIRKELVKPRQSPECLMTFMRRLKELNTEGKL